MPKKTRFARSFLPLTIAALAPLASLHAQRRFPATAAEIAASEARVRTNVPFIDQIAAQLFKEMGERYVTPHLVGYNNTFETRCGSLPPENAFACRADSTVYYEREFIASIMASASRALHTEGDMTAVFSIAHEWGHQLQYMLHVDYSAARVRSETDADCLAGVIMHRYKDQGRFKNGALEEIQYAMRVIGDSLLSPGVWGDVIERINLSRPPGSVPPIINAYGNHGNPRERLEAFTHGFTASASSCVEGIRRPNKIAFSGPLQWYVNNVADAYNLAVAENKPLVLVSGDVNGQFFQRLKRETLESPEMATLRNVAIFAYSDPARDITARNIGTSLGYERLPIVSLLAPNANGLDEAVRIVGLWDAPTMLRELSKPLIKRGWMRANGSAPWMPPRP
ncbi:MAG: neutral zinc metallopeptidase [Gemmatimonadaceae bacterium]